jgi:16S rRNA (guanine527-N7)-methyltransferase
MEETLKQYFDNTTQPEIEKLLKLEELYKGWNSKINVISRKDIDNFNIHHLLHSLSVAKVIRFTKGSEIIDIGTGGGFPGIPLSIMFPEVSFTLVDSIRKKTLVVKSVAESLDLKNVKVVCDRAENIDNKYDFVISRAVTAFPKFVMWTKNMIKTQNNNTLRNGILYLKGGDLSKELGAYKNRVTIYPLGNYFRESFFEEKKIVYLPA